MRRAETTTRRAETATPVSAPLRQQWQEWIYGVLTDPLARNAPRTPLGPCFARRPVYSYVAETFYTIATMVRYALIDQEGQVNAVARPTRA